MSLRFPQSKHVELALLLSILLLSVFLRLFRFQERVGWVNDIGRDILAGYLIQSEHQRPTEGHWNSGINFVYPPNYYYLLSVMHSISKDEYFVLGALTFLQALTPLLLYGILKQHLSRRTSLLVALLYTIAPFSIQMSLFHLSAHVSVIPFLMSVLLLSKYLRTPKWFLMGLSVFLLILSSSLFYGNLIFVPFYGMLFLFTAANKRQLLNKGSQYQTFLIISILICFGSLIQQGKSDQLMGLGGEQGFTGSFVDSFSQIPALAVTEVGRVFPQSTLGAVGVCIAVLFLLLATKQQKYYKALLLFILIFVTHVAFLSVKTTPLAHYLVLLTPFYFFAIAVMLDGVRAVKGVGTVLYVGLLICSCYCLGVSRLPQLLSQKDVSTYTVAKDLAERLMQTYPGYGFYVYKEHSPYEWESRTYWYFMRENVPFTIEGTNGQIELNTTRVLNVCQQSVDTNSTYCSTLQSEFKPTELRRFLSKDQAVELIVFER